MKHLNLLGQRSMDKRNGDRSFTDCRRHALGVAASNIADGEHSGPRRFEQIRRALEGPLRRGEIFRCQVRSGFDEAFRVERDVTIQPTRIRLRARFDVPDGRAESCRGSRRRHDPPDGGPNELPHNVLHNHRRPQGTTGAHRLGVVTAS